MADRRWHSLSPSAQRAQPLALSHSTAAAERPRAGHRRPERGAGRAFARGARWRGSAREARRCGVDGAACAGALPTAGGADRRALDMAAGVAPRRRRRRRMPPPWFRPVDTRGRSAAARRVGGDGARGSRLRIRVRALRRGEPRCLRGLRRPIRIAHGAATSVVVSRALRSRCRRSRRRSPSRSVAGRSVAGRRLSRASRSAGGVSASADTGAATRTATATDDCRPATDDCRLTTADDSD